MKPLKTAALGLCALLAASGSASAEDCDETEATPLVSAISGRATLSEVSEMLGTRKGRRSVNKRARYASTPLIAAILRGTDDPEGLRIAKALLSAGADPNREDCSYKPVSPVHALFSERSKAGEAEVTEVFRLLVASGLKIEASLLAELLHHKSLAVPLDVAALLIQRGCHVDVELPEGERETITPLMAAARAGRSDLVRLLLDAGADPNRLSAKYGSNALDFALKASDFRTVKELVSRGARVSEAFHEEGWADRMDAHLTYAIDMRGSLQGSERDEIIDLVLHAGGDPFTWFGYVLDSLDLMPAEKAMLIDDEALFRKFLTLGAGAEELSRLLVLSVRHGRPRYFRILKEFGAVLPRTIQIDYGVQVPFAWYLGKRASWEDIQFLLDEKAIALDDEGGALFLSATRAGRFKEVSNLLARGGSRYVSQALVPAIQSGSVETLRLLVDNGANIDHVSDFSWDCRGRNAESYYSATGDSALDGICDADRGSALKTAITSGNHAMVDLILARNPKIDLIVQGRSALLEASSLMSNPSSQSDWKRLPSKELAVRKLVASGADVNLADSEGNTALMLAVTTRYEDHKNRLWEDTAFEIVKTLWKAGADLRRMNLRGETAQGIAERAGWTKMSDFLKLIGG